MNTALQGAQAEFQAAAQEAQAGAAGAQPEGNAPAEDDVQDVDFEEVEEEEKK